MTLHEARRMWMQLDPKLRGRVMLGEPIRVARRQSLPPFSETVSAIGEMPIPVHVFRAIRHESWPGVTVTIFCDNMVIHVMQERS